MQRKITNEVQKQARPNPNSNFAGADLSCIQDLGLNECKIDCGGKSFWKSVDDAGKSFAHGLSSFGNSMAEASNGELM